MRVADCSLPDTHLLLRLDHAWALGLGTLIKDTVEDCKVSKLDNMEILERYQPHFGTIGTFSALPCWKCAVLCVSYITCDLLMSHVCVLFSAVEGPSTGIRRSLW
jgi:hypothetical protein